MVERSLKRSVLAGEEGDLYVIYWIKDSALRPVLLLEDRVMIETMRIEQPSVKGVT